MQMTGKIRLDLEHRYWACDNRVPGFTEICKDLGVIKDNAFYTEAGRQEGNALHKWLAFLASGNEPESEPDPRIAGRVEGIRKFLRESSFKTAGCEIPQYHAELNFACTPDLFGYMGAFASVIDCKRGAKEPWHALQTAAQLIALRANGFLAQKRYGLYLRDGGYRLIEHLDVGDMSRWKTLVGAHNAKSFYS